MTNDWVAKKLHETIADNTDIFVNGMAAELCKRFETGTTKKRLYIAKKKSLSITATDFISLYAKWLWLCVIDKKCQRKNKDSLRPYRSIQEKFY